jgi:transcriptional regulator with XRE-family HTH domain
MAIMTDLLPGLRTTARLTSVTRAVNTYHNLNARPRAVNGFFGLFSGFMPGDDRRAIGWRIRTARERAGLTREELGARVGVHPGSIARWETGGSAPHAYTLGRIADACGASHEWLRTGADAAGASAEPDSTDAADADDVFASLDAVVRFVEGFGPPGQERLRKLDALEGLRRMLTARGILPDWWYLLKERVENGGL